MGSVAETVIVNDVGLRDGIQAQPKFVTTDQKLAILGDLLAAGLRHFEVTSFVSPKAVPQMADAAELAERLPRVSGACYSALVPNERGFQRAVASGIRTVATVTCTTETMNRRNTNMSLTEAIQSAVAVIRAARAADVRVRAYVATAAGCPFEGEVPPLAVMRLAEQLLAAGAHEIVVADTIGAANPAAMQSLLDGLIRQFGTECLAVHFHDTRGMGLALAWVAAELGIRRFDSSIGGLGGCPFAPGASGNLATEDLVLMLQGAGFDAGIDFGRLAAASNALGAVFEHLPRPRSVQWFNSRQVRA